ncbi:pseudouridine synthase [Bacillus sp. Marseille-P3661]|uniref:pseudouridine synthase n=1 Tax=Bacillus sp. Marseille-P3661 TaxID=1936234 RepID=UPI000C832FA3|nr:pseudouridine synthase [Bacillus sp. Marseille-P3661]
MRINKFISSSGLCSHRQAERLLAAQKVTVNGIIPESNYIVKSTDVILVEGKPLPTKERSIYIKLNKPVGIVCTNDRSVKNNIAEFMNYEERVFPIGRLDKDSEGLILLTNDGEITNKIIHSESNHEKEYIVTVDKVITSDFLEGMSNGVEILNTKTRQCRVSKVDDVTFRIVLTQGLNRQIRRMCKIFDYRVLKLQRVRIMNIMLGNLEPGEWRELTIDEISDLKFLLDL